ncbi:MAG: flagellar basal body L-ring protein FlgH [Bdellovibrionales bacterium]|nr:flagellar basal body L-ring protein FlgH [Bdellovibrionales bacterium]
MKTRAFALFLLASTLLFFNLGCASFGKKLKAFLGGKPSAEEAAPKEELPPTYSANPNLMQGPHRQYRRVTKRDLEDEALLGEKAGSLWTMEGQGAYLFSQNIIRMVGDPIGIKIEGDAKEQLETKVSVIGTLLARLEERQLARMRQPANDAQAQNGPEGSVPAPEGGDKKESPNSKNPAASPMKADFNVKNVPTRIVERLVDGNYRVKGSQPFMIGQREYKVIVTGIVRAEDFNEEGLSASKLLDPKFDIVSVRRKDEEI